MSASVEQNERQINYGGREGPFRGHWGGLESQPHLSALSLTLSQFVLRTEDTQESELLLDVNLGKICR